RNRKQKKQYFFRLVEVVHTKMLVNKCNIYLPNDGIGLLTVAQLLSIGGVLKIGFWQSLC
ncbi:MAG: hypothetical protein KAY50_07230, partial [Chitinophagaceae bacterium]|nr:hypothetical protein [Chitinophagaceae bacterium]